MPRPKSPLWLSGLLLILAYSAFGWHWLPESARKIGISYVSWTVLIVMVITVNIMATYPDRVFSALFQAIFGADVRSLFLVMALSTALIFVLTGLTIFAQLMLLLSAALLFSMELHEVGTDRIHILLILLLGQTAGLLLGFGGKIASANYLQRMLEFMG